MLNIFLNSTNCFIMGFFFSVIPKYSYQPISSFPTHIPGLYFPNFLAVSYIWPYDQILSKWYVGRGDEHK